MKDLSVSSSRVVAFDWEEVYGEIDKLEGKEIIEVAGSTLYSGFHPALGAVHIVVPAAGPGLILLPFTRQIKPLESLAS